MSRLTPVGEGNCFSDTPRLTAPLKSPPFTTDIVRGGCSPHSMYLITRKRERYRMTTPRKPFPQNHRDGTLDNRYHRNGEHLSRPTCDPGNSFTDEGIDVHNVLRAGGGPHDVRNRPLQPSSRNPDPISLTRSITAARQQTIYSKENGPSTLKQRGGGSETKFLRRYTQQPEDERGRSNSLEGRDSMRRRSLVIRGQLRFSQENNSEILPGRELRAYNGQQSRIDMDRRICRQGSSDGWDAANNGSDDQRCGFGEFREPHHLEDERTHRWNNYTRPWSQHFTQSSCTGSHSSAGPKSIVRHYQQPPRSSSSSSSPLRFGDVMFSPSIPHVGNSYESTRDHMARMSYATRREGGIELPAPDKRSTSRSSRKNRRMDFQKPLRFEQSTSCTQSRMNADSSGVVNENQNWRQRDGWTNSNSGPIAFFPYGNEIRKEIPALSRTASSSRSSFFSSPTPYRRPSQDDQPKPWLKGRQFFNRHSGNPAGIAHTRSQSPAMTSAYQRSADSESVEIQRRQQQRHNPGEAGFDKRQRNDADFPIRNPQHRRSRYEPTICSAAPQHQGEPSDQERTVMNILSSSNEIGQEETLEEGEAVAEEDVVNEGGRLPVLTSKEADIESESPSVEFSSFGMKSFIPDCLSTLEQSSDGVLSLQPVTETIQTTTSEPVSSVGDSPTENQTAKCGVKSCKISVLPQPSKELVSPEHPYVELQQHAQIQDHSQREQSEDLQAFHAPRNKSTVNAAGGTISERAYHAATPRKHVEPDGDGNAAVDDLLCSPPSKKRRFLCESMVKESYLEQQDDCSNFCEIDAVCNHTFESPGDLSHGQLHAVVVDDRCTKCPDNGCSDNAVVEDANVQPRHGNADRPTADVTPVPRKRGYSTELNFDRSFRKAQRCGRQRAKRSNVLNSDEDASTTDDSSSPDVSSSCPIFSSPDCSLRQQSPTNSPRPDLTLPLTMNGRSGQDISTTEQRVASSSPCGEKTSPSLPSEPATVTPTSSEDIKECNAASEFSGSRSVKRLKPSQDSTVTGLHRTKRRTMRVVDSGSEEDVNVSSRFRSAVKEVASEVADVSAKPDSVQKKCEFRSTIRERSEDHMANPAETPSSRARDVYLLESQSEVHSQPAAMENKREPEPVVAPLISSAEVPAAGVLSPADVVIPRKKAAVLAATARDAETIHKGRDREEHFSSKKWFSAQFPTIKKKSSSVPVTKSNSTSEARTTSKGDKKLKKSRVISPSVADTPVEKVCPKMDKQEVAASCHKIRSRLNREINENDPCHNTSHAAATSQRTVISLPAAVPATVPAPVMLSELSTDLSPRVDDSTKLTRGVPEYFGPHFTPGASKVASNSSGSPMVTDDDEDEVLARRTSSCVIAITSEPPSDLDCRRTFSCDSLPQAVSKDSERLGNAIKSEVGTADLPVISNLEISTLVSNSSSYVLTDREIPNRAVSLSTRSQEEGHINVSQNISKDRIKQGADEEDYCCIFLSSVAEKPPQDNDTIPVGVQTSKVEQDTEPGDKGRTTPADIEDVLATGAAILPNESTVTRRKSSGDRFSRELCSLYQDLINSGASQLLTEEGRTRPGRGMLGTMKKQHTKIAPPLSGKKKNKSQFQSTGKGGSSRPLDKVSELEGNAEELKETTTVHHIPKRGRPPKVQKKVEEETTADKEKRTTHHQNEGVEENLPSATVEFHVNEELKDPNPAINQQHCPSHKSATSQSPRLVSTYNTEANRGDSLETSCLPLTPRKSDSLQRVTWQKENKSSGRGKILRSNSRQSIKNLTTQQTRTDKTSPNNLPSRHPHIRKNSIQEVIDEELQDSPHRGYLCEDDESMWDIDRNQFNIADDEYLANRFLSLIPPTISSKLISSWLSEIPSAGVDNSAATKGVASGEVMHSPLFFLSSNQTACSL